MSVTIDSCWLELTVPTVTLALHEKGVVKGVFPNQKDKTYLASEDRIRLNHEIKWNENIESYTLL